MLKFGIRYIDMQHSHSISFFSCINSVKMIARHTDKITHAYHSSNRSLLTFLYLTKSVNLLYATLCIADPCLHCASCWRFEGQWPHISDVSVTAEFVWVGLGMNLWCRLAPILTSLWVKYVLQRFEKPRNRLSGETTIFGASPSAVFFPPQPCSRSWEGWTSLDDKCL